MSDALEPDLAVTQAWELLDKRFNRYAAWTASETSLDTWDGHIRALQQQWRLGSGGIATFSAFEGLIEIEFGENDSYVASTTQLIRGGESAEYSELERRLVGAWPLPSSGSLFGLIADDGTVLGLVERIDEIDLAVLALADRPVPDALQLLALDMFWHMVEASQLKLINTLAYQTSTCFYCVRSGEREFGVWLPESVVAASGSDPHFVAGVPYGFYPHGTRLNPERFPEHNYPRAITRDDLDWWREHGVVRLLADADND